MLPNGPIARIIAGPQFRKATDLTETVADLTHVPSMGGSEIGEFLRRNAADVSAPRAIVEIGTWLGAGTLHLARGAVGRDDAPAIHSYDIFHASESEVRRAARQGLNLEIGGDTRPLVKSWIDPIGADVTLHKGDILKARWDGPEIGLYVDDAAKTPTLFYHVLDTFAPFWIPGETLVVLMDYGFWKKYKDRRSRKRMRVQQDLVEANPQCFEQIHDPSFEGSIAAFRYLAPLPFARIRRQAGMRRFLSRLPG